MAAHDTSLLAAESLYVSLGGMPILRDVSLHVGASEAVAVLGGNGSGKTTLIRAATGLVPHQEGSVELFGTPINRFRDWHRLGYVPQHGTMHVTHATVGEVVSSGRLSHLKPFQPRRRADRDAIGRALEQVGLSERTDWPFRTLSGGQKQRALIARALSSQPELLVMDEPFAGVDLHSQDGLADLLCDLRNQGLGMALVLHELGAMEGVLDRSITLCDGRMVDPEYPLDVAPDCPPAMEPSPVGLRHPLAGSAS